MLTKEDLGVTDSGIIRMRRALIKAARELRDHNTLPPAVNRPGLYGVRSTCLMVPDGVNRIEASREQQWVSVNEPPKLQALA